MCRRPIYFAPLIMIFVMGGCRSWTPNQFGLPVSEMGNSKHSNPPSEQGTERDLGQEIQLIRQPHQLTDSAYPDADIETAEVPSSGEMQLEKLLDERVQQRQSAEQQYAQQRAAKLGQVLLDSSSPPNSRSTTDHENGQSASSATMPAPAPHSAKREWNEVQLRLLETLNYIDDPAQRAKVLQLVLANNSPANAGHLASPNPDVSDANVPSDSVKMGVQDPNRISSGDASSDSQWEQQEALRRIAELQAEQNRRLVGPNPLASSGLDLLGGGNATGGGALQGQLNMLQDAIKQYESQSNSLRNSNFDRGSLDGLGHSSLESQPATNSTHAQVGFSSQATGDLPPVGAWKKHIHETIQALEANRSRTEPLLSQAEREQQEIILRFLYMLIEEREKALTGIASLEESEQAFLKELIFGLSERYANKSLDLESPMFASNPRQKAISNHHIRKALGHSANQATLQIRNLAFCQAIQGFGAYQSFSTQSFRPGNEILLYCELENLTADSRPLSDHQLFESKIHGSLAVYDENRQVVHQVDYEDVVDSGRNRRLDFYVHFSWKIPKLEPGRYFAQLTIHDLYGNKTATSASPLEFEVQ